MARDSTNGIFDIVEHEVPRPSFCHHTIPVVWKAPLQCLSWGIDGGQGLTVCLLHSSDGVMLIATGCGLCLRGSGSRVFASIHGWEETLSWVVGKVL
jgi:hypothetical protein